MKKFFPFFSSPPTRESPPPHTGKIEVFSRHCITSSISQHKKRLPGFDRAKCYRNLLATADLARVNFTFFLDTARGDPRGHYLYPPGGIEGVVVELSEGSEAGAFLRLLDFVEKLSLDPGTILYFVEDDYLHRPGWIDILEEGFQIEGADYITLFDHRDKYFFPSYSKLRAQLFATASCHWRTTPSTTQTFATRFKTLIEDLPIHRRFSQKRAISADHEKFCYLGKRGRRLLSSIPGWSTHVEEPFASPCIDWDPYLRMN